MLQIYPSKKQEINDDIIERAKKAGFKALVITCDTSIRGNRESDIKNQFSLPSNLKFKIWSRYVEKDAYKHKTGTSAHADFLKHFIDGSFSWENVRQYKQKYNFPIVIKGIMSPEDAVEAVKCGADGIWVSNHGGR